MQRLIFAMLIIAALIHFIPVTGVLGAGHLARLYGVQLHDPNSLILMQHRAVMLGLIGLLLAAAAFIPAYRPLAYVGGLVSVIAFVLVACAHGGYNALLERVVMADVIAAGCLLLALAVDIGQARTSR